MGYGANTVVTKLNYRQKPKTINTFIYEGKIKVDSNYFIKKINKGIKDSEYNYKTYKFRILVGSTAVPRVVQL